MRTNYHTHTKRCLHAFGTEEDYISAALNAGVSVLGFSDHAPFPDVDYGYRMPYSELGEYFAAVDRLREERADDIIIKKSLEIEYLNRAEGSRKSHSPSRIPRSHDQRREPVLVHDGKAAWQGRRGEVLPRGRDAVDAGTQLKPAAPRRSFGYGTIPQTAPCGLFSFLAFSAFPLRAFYCSFILL